jgi:hypothetical protein
MNPGPTNPSSSGIPGQKPGPVVNPAPGRVFPDQPHHTRTLMDPGHNTSGHLTGHGSLDPNATGHSSSHATRNPNGRVPGLRLIRTELSPEVSSKHTKPLRAKLANEVGAENRRASALSERDLRRIIAQRVAENIDGGRAGILVPERRQALVSTAQRMGMRPFDANLIIAIVQDRFRRGLLGAAGASHDERLELIAAPTRGGSISSIEAADTLPHPALIERRRERFWLSVRLLLASLAIAGILTVWLVNWLTGRLP